MRWSVMVYADAPCVGYKTMVVDNVKERDILVNELLEMGYYDEYSSRYVPVKYIDYSKYRMTDAYYYPEVVVLDDLENADNPPIDW